MSGRHSRQSRLRDVGSEGQARIVAGHVRVGGDDLRARVTTRYLAGAGVGTLDVSGSLADVARRTDPSVVIAPGGRDMPRTDDIALRDPACASVAQGALDALATLRRLLAGDRLP